MSNEMVAGDSARGAVARLAILLSGRRVVSEVEQHYKAGVELGNQGKLNEAIVEFSKAIEMDPKMAAAYNNRGFVYRKLGQPQRAIQDYDEAIRLDPELALAYYNRGFAYFNLGELERAIQDFDDAIHLNPQDANAYATRALTLTALGRDTLAHQDFDRAVELGFDPAVLKEWLEGGEGEAMQRSGSKWKVLGVLLMITLGSVMLGFIMAIVPGLVLGLLGWHTKAAWIVPIVWAVGYVWQRAKKFRDVNWVTFILAGFGGLGIGISIWVFGNITS